MTSQHREVSWKLLHGAVKGIAKKYSQDSSAVRSTADGRAVILTVADGHGSAAHHRSDLGSRWAVEEFAACAEIFANDAVLRGADPVNWPLLKASARSLPKEVVHRWRRRALLHESNAPAAGGLPEPPEPPGRPRRRRRTRAEPDLSAYGSTLLGAVATDRMVVCWQLGDGDIVLVGETGEIDTPMYSGPDLGDETDSLCEREAWRRMGVYWRPFTGDEPVPAILLSTDGLSKSFTDQKGFVEFATGVCERARAKGLPAVQAQLRDWLSRAAAHSGDDTTLVGAFAGTAFGPPQPDYPEDMGGPQAGS